jgi:chemotaxis protein MotB
MGKWLAGLVVILALVVAALYWWIYRPEHEALRASQQRLSVVETDAAALRTQVADLDAIRHELVRTSTELQDQVAAKEKELTALHSTQNELVEGLKQEIADRQVQVEQIRDRLRVDMVNEILFDSGEATIKAQGIEVLRKVGAALAKVKDRPIEVQGHTDNVPIAGALAGRFPTNWELSAARAINVARFLQETAGIDPTRLSATAHSEFQPRASNDTEEGRRLNRRIEIMLGPVVTGGEPVEP